MTMLERTSASFGADARAFVLLKSGRRLDLLDPDPEAWTDGDLAAGLSRTMRWGGASRWAQPLSVAQHSLTVLAIREAEGPLTAREGLRELLHDAAEFMLGWDCIAPLKAQLGAPFRELETRLQAAVDARYRLPSWTAEDYAKHKRADRLAAASEAFHVVGWSRTDMVEALGIAIPPLLDDPLPPNGFARWEPWPPEAAQHHFMARFRELAPASNNHRRRPSRFRSCRSSPPPLDRRRCQPAADHTPPDFSPRTGRTSASFQRCCREPGETGLQRPRLVVMASTAIGPSHSARRFRLCGVADFVEDSSARRHARVKFRRGGGAASCRTTGI